MKDFFAPLGRLRAWTVIGAAAVAAIVWALSYVSGVDLLLWQVILLAVAIVTVASVLSALRPDTEPGPPLTTRKINDPTWRPFAEVNRWEDQLIFAETKPGRFEQSPVKRRIVELAEERLRLRRGLSLSHDPEKCREALGERTYAFVTGPIPDCPTEFQLDEHLRRIEEI